MGGGWWRLVCHFSDFQYENAARQSWQTDSRAGELFVLNACNRMLGWIQMQEHNVAAAVRVCGFGPMQISRYISRITAIHPDKRAIYRTFHRNKEIKDTIQELHLVSQSIAFQNLIQWRVLRCWEKCFVNLGKTCNLKTCTNQILSQVTQWYEEYNILGIYSNLPLNPFSLRWNWISNSSKVVSLDNWQFVCNEQLEIFRPQNKITQ